MAGSDEGAGAREGAPRESWRALAWAVACVAIYLALFTLEAALWEPAHDEGVTWTQAIGRVELRVPPARPTPIREVYAALDGVPGHSGAEVLERLMVEGGMHPPAYYLGVNAWSRLFGSGRLVLTFPAMLAGVLTLFGMRRLARELIPEGGEEPHGSASARRAGDWAMLLTALSPWLVGYSVLARPYAIALCLGVWSTVAMFAMLRGEGARRAQVAFVVLSLLGVYHVYHFAFLLLWQLCFLGLSALLVEAERRRGRLIALVQAAVAIVLGFAPWLPRLITHLGVTGDADTYFTGFPGLAEWPGLASRLMLDLALGEVIRFYEPPVQQLAFWVLAAGTLALLVTGLGEREAGSAGRPSSVGLLWVSLPLLPAAILAADWLHDTRTLFVTKTGFVLFPFLVLLVVRAWLSFPSRSLAALGLGAWALLLAAATAGGLHGLALRQTPVAWVTAYLLETDHAGHVVALSSLSPGYAIPLVLSLRRAGVEEVSLAYAPWYALPEFVEAASSDPSIERLSLINLDVSYSPFETWQPKLLRHVQAQAERAGWDARVRVPRDAASEAAGFADEGRLLRIVTPIQSKYFSG